MKKKFLMIVVMLILIGCSVQTEDLINGTWMATKGYQNGEVQGEATCYPFQEGVEFKDEGTAFIEVFDRDFEYELRNRYKEIVFNDSGPVDSTNEDSITMSHRYTIKKISDDEIVLEGQGLSEGKNCLLERQ